MINENKPNKGMPNIDPSMSNNELEEIRSIILGLDQYELTKLKKWLADPEYFSKEIVGILPDAILNLVSSGRVPYDKLIDLLEKLVDESVMRNPLRLANSLYPVMMPAIRKAVSEDMKKMMNSLNSTLENSVSVKRLTWRFQSLFSGKSYAEIVLANSLLYNVKQVFLIHKETGLLLQEVHDENFGQKDADIVSSMLKAINDFVRDSFDVQSQDELEIIQIGKLNVWIEVGPNAIIAAIVEGTPPGELRTTFKQATEAIHIDYSTELKEFSGNTGPFERDKQHIALCLQKEQKFSGSRPPYAVVLLILTIIALIAFWIYHATESNKKWNGLLTDLENEPGIVVVDAEKKWNGMKLYGIKDLIAKDPAEIYTEAGYDAADIDDHWKAYISLEAPIIVSRAYKRLIPPDSVCLSYANETLFAIGDANQLWVEFAKVEALELLGVEAFNYDELNINIVRDIEFLEYEIERQIFEFGFRVLELNASQINRFNVFVYNVKELKRLADESNISCSIGVTAYTNKLGNPRANEEYAWTRADRFKEMLIENGIDEEFIVTDIIIFDDENHRDGINARSVTIDVIHHEN